MLKALLTELARDGAGGDPMNYKQPVTQALCDLQRIQVALAKIVSRDCREGAEGAAMKMIPVIIDWRDGVYSMFRADVGYYSDWKPTIEIPEPLWEAYNDFALQAHVWDRIIGRLDNQAYEDREREAES